MSMLNTDSIHVFRITEPNDQLRVARLSPATATELTTFLQTPSDRRVTMMGTEQVQQMSANQNVAIVDPNDEDNNLAEDDDPFGVPVIYRGHEDDGAPSKAEARKQVAEAMGVPRKKFSGVKVVDGYPGQGNNPEKMTLSNSLCQTTRVVSGYTTFLLEMNGRDVRASLVDWGGGDQKLVLFDNKTDEFLGLRTKTTHHLGATVLNAQRVKMSCDFDIKVTNRPIALAFDYEVDPEKESDRGATDYEAGEVARVLEKISPLVSVPATDHEVYESDDPNALIVEENTALSEQKVQGLGGASINGYVRKDKVANGPQSTDRVRLVVLENLFE